MTATLKVTVSGKTYDACLDDKVSSVPREIGLDKVPSTWAKIGRGYQVTWAAMPVAVAEALHDHLVTVGEGFAAGDDPDTRAEGRAILKDARRLGARITEATT